MVKIETAIGLGIKSSFGIMGFSTSDAILGLWVFLFNRTQGGKEAEQGRANGKGSSSGNAGPRTGVSPCCCCQVLSVVSDSVQPHRWQPTRLPRPWDSPGKSTGVGCHCLLQCMKVKSESEVTQSCPTLRDPMDCSPPGSSVHGIFQARVLEWGAIAFSRVSLG